MTRWGTDALSNAERSQFEWKVWSRFIFLNLRPELEDSINGVPFNRSLTFDAAMAVPPDKSTENQKVGSRLNPMRLY